MVDTITSIFAGFVVFAILGVMAKEAGTTVENVITSSESIYTLYACIWDCIKFMYGDAHVYLFVE